MFRRPFLFLAMQLVIRQKMIPPMSGGPASGDRLGLNRTRQEVDQRAADDQVHDLQQHDAHHGQPR